MMLSPLSAYASATNAPQTSENKAETLQLTQALVDKASPFITIKDNRFLLAKEAKDSLDKNEYKLVDDYVKLSNKTLEQIAEDQLIVTEKNSFRIKPAGISIQSINTSAYSDYELFWWGIRYFWSSQLLQDSKSWSLETWAAVITKPLPIPANFKTLIVATVYNGLNTIYQANYLNRGVYCDMFYPINPYVSILTMKVYSA